MYTNMRISIYTSSSNRLTRCLTSIQSTRANSTKYNTYRYTSPDYTTIIATMYISTTTVYYLDLSALVSVECHRVISIRYIVIRPD